MQEIIAVNQSNYDSSLDAAMGSSVNSRHARLLSLALTNAKSKSALLRTIEDLLNTPLEAHSIIDGEAVLCSRPQQVISPSEMADISGVRHDCGKDHIELALSSGYLATEKWSGTSREARAALIKSATGLIEEQATELVAILYKEAGLPLNEGFLEVQETIDACSKIASQITENATESPYGLFLCTSDNDSSLTQFATHITTALATGNSVLAHPSSLNSIISTRLIQFFHEAGIPSSALQLVIFDSANLGISLVNDSRIRGVTHAGELDTAISLKQNLAQQHTHNLPFICQTNGLNIMLAESAASISKLVDSIMTHAFRNAGQHPASLNAIYLEDDIADGIIAALKDRLAKLSPAAIGLGSTNIAPLKNQAQRLSVAEYAAELEQQAKLVMAAPVNEDQLDSNYFAPRIYEIDSIKQVEQGIAGPLLYLIRFNGQSLDNVVSDISNSQNQSTLFVHSANESLIHILLDDAPSTGIENSRPNSSLTAPNYLSRYQAPIDSGTAIKPNEAVELIESSRAFRGLQEAGETEILALRPLGNLLMVLNEQTPIKSLVQICNIALALGNTLTFSVRNIANRAQYEALMLDIPEEFHSNIAVNEENLLARVSNKAHQAVVVHHSHPELDKFKPRVAKREDSIVSLLEYDESVLLRENLDWYIAYMSKLVVKKSI